MNSESSIREILKKLQSRQRHINRLTEEIIRDHIKKYYIQNKPVRIYCLSSRFDSVLMWSHYADSHSGICVEIEADIQKKFGFIPFLSRSINCELFVSGQFLKNGRFKKKKKSIEEHMLAFPAHQVAYTSNVPELICQLNNEDRIAISSQFVKHSAWSYEEEFRIVIDEQFIRNNPVEMDVNSITGVIFGLRIKKGDAICVRNAIESSDRAKPVRFYKMDKVDGTFEIKKEAINDVDIFIESLKA